VKHILEESQATVKLQPDGVLHSVSQAAEEAQIGPSLSLLALLAKKQRTQVLDPPQIQSPQISPSPAPFFFFFFFVSRSSYLSLVFFPPILGLREEQE
jgi:hypothetical protein